MSEAAHWLGVAMALAAAACALGAVLARSLVAMIMFISAAFAFGAGALMARGAGDAAPALALFGVGLMPVLLMTLLALTARAAKTRRGALPWAAIAAACVLCALLLAGAPEFARRAELNAAALEPFVFWLVPLLACAAIGCLGVLGFGERGAFGAGAD